MFYDTDPTVEESELEKAITSSNLKETIELLDKFWSGILELLCPQCHSLRRPERMDDPIDCNKKAVALDLSWYSLNTHFNLGSTT